MRLSPRARRRRIVVRPHRVTVVGPAGDSPRALRRLARRRRKWIAARQARLRKRQRRLAELTSCRFADGGHVTFRGRRLPLDVHRCGEAGGVELRDAVLHVHLPSDPGPDAVRQCVGGWLAGRLREEGERLSKLYAGRLSVEPPPVRVRDMSSRWGSLGRTGRLTLSLRLAHLPAWAWEQVVAHEVCHLRVRSHSGEFYRLLWSVLPPEIPRVRRLERALGVD